MNQRVFHQPIPPTSGGAGDLSSASRNSLIDVVIPVHNCERTVEAAIDSILRQSVSDLRVIVVDDGSTDNTLGIVRRMASDDSRMQVLSKPNGGIVDALNLGLSICTATYFARHDGDDLAYPHRFERQLAYLTAHPDCIAIGAWARLIDANGVPTGDYSRAAAPETAQANSVPAREPYLLHPFMMARLDAVQAVGGYRHNLLAEDSDLYWRLQEMGSLVNLPEILGDYRIHATSTTARSIARGRINALFSELAALSAVRRRSGLPDLDFTRDFVAQVTRCDGIAEVFAAGAAKVTESERKWLEIAVAAKLIDLCFTRHYSLAAQDCHFIRAAFDARWPQLDEKGRTDNNERLIGLAKALIEHGHFDLAILVSPPRLYPRLLLRLAFRWLVPSTLRRKLKSIVGRAN